MITWTISLGDLLMLTTVVLAVVLNWADVRARLKALETWVKDHREKHDRFDREFHELELSVERHHAKFNGKEQAPPA